MRQHLSPEVPVVVDSPEMFTEITDTVRALAHDAILSKRGNNVRGVKALRTVLEIANEIVGRPACTREEIASRRATAGVPSVASGTASAATSAAPRAGALVAVYFDGKDHRTLKKIEDLLVAREIAYQILDVSEDEASRSWALATSKHAEFPIVFIAGDPVGGLHELTQLDVNGTLKSRVV